MAQVSQELIDLLSVESLSVRIKDLTDMIGKEELLDEGSYTLEGQEYAKK